MKAAILVLSLVWFQLALHADEPFSGELKLKLRPLDSKVPMSDSRTPAISNMLTSNEYQIVLDGGTATTKYKEQGKERDGKGTITLTILNGMDPLTKTRAKFIGSLRIEITNPGWNRDKFITRIEIPLEQTRVMQKVTGSPIPEPVLGLAATATVDQLWLDELSNGTRRYIDPMGIRMHFDYSVEVIKNPFQPPTPSELAARFDHSYAWFDQGGCGRLNLYLHEYLLAHPDAMSYVGNTEEVEVKGFAESLAKMPPIKVSDQNGIKQALKIANGHVYSTWGAEIHFAVDRDHDGFVTVGKQRSSTKYGVSDPFAYDKNYHYKWATGIFVSLPDKMLPGSSSSIVTLDDNDYDRLKQK
jgi:hypothetical protein